MLKPLIAATKRQRLAPAHVPLIPVDLALSNQEFPTGSPAGTVVGVLTAFPEVGEYDYVLTDDAGGKFAIFEDALVIGSTPSVGSEFLPVTIRAVGKFSKLWYEKTFGVEAQTVVSPIEITPTSLTILENSAAGTQVGAVTSPGSTLSMTNTAGNRFALSASNIVAGAVPTDYETATSHDVTIRADYDGKFITRDLTVQVINVVEITNITLSASTIPENSAAGTIVGTLASVPAGATLTLTNDAGGRFAIDGSNRLVAGSVATDFETNATHDVTVRATQGPDVYDRTFTVTVTNVNELTDITLSANLILENSAAGTIVGDLASVIPGATFAVTSQVPNNTFFTVNGASQLVAGATPTNYEANATHTVTVQATKGTDVFSKPLTVNVTDVDEISDITLSNNSIAENSALGTQVGLLASTPTGATFALAGTNPSGTRFRIVGNELQQGATANDYELGTSYIVRVQATRLSETLEKDFTVNITDVANVTDVTLSPSSVAENTAQGNTVGTLASVPTGATFALTNNAGNRFQLSGSTIQTGSVATDYETATSHNIVVRATRQGEILDKTLTINVTDVGEVVPVTDIALSGNSIQENSAQGTNVGTLSSTPGGATFTLTNSASNRFQISGTSLQAGSTATDYETSTSHSVTVRATLNGQTRDESFTINVTDVAEGGGDEVTENGIAQTDEYETGRAQGHSFAVAMFIPRDQNELTNASSATWTMTNTGGGKFQVTSSGTIQQGPTPNVADTDVTVTLQVTVPGGAVRSFDWTFHINASGTFRGSGNSTYLGAAIGAQTSTNNSTWVNGTPSSYLWETWKGHTVVPTSPNSNTTAWNDGTATSGFYSSVVRCTGVNGAETGHVYHVVCFY